MSKIDWSAYNIYIGHGTKHGGHTKWTVHMRDRNEPMFKLSVWEYEIGHKIDLEVNLCQLDPEKLSVPEIIRCELMHILDQYLIVHAVEYREFLRRGGINVCH